jgi:hypothetical protein
MSPIVGRKLVDIFESKKVFKPSLNNQPTKYKFNGQNTKFTIGNVRYIVNTELDKEEQYKALDIFNNKFRNIQYDNIKMLREGKLGEGHNGRWICVTAGDGVWDPQTGSWEMLPKIVQWSDGTDIKDDRFVMSDLGENAILGENRKGDPTFCVPEKYDLLIKIFSRIPSGSVLSVLANYEY